MTRVSEVALGGWTRDVLERVTAAHRASARQRHLPGLLLGRPPSPALDQAIAGAPGVDLRMLNVLRDPRAVAWSWQRELAARRRPDREQHAT